MGSNSENPGRAFGMSQRGLQGVARRATSLLLYSTAIFHGGSTHAQGTVPFEVYVDPRESVVNAATATFDASIRMRGLPEEGLFSYGVQVFYPTDILAVAGPGSVSLVEALDFNGPFRLGALKSLSPGVVGIKGTVDLGTPTLTPYTGELLATVHFQLASPTTFGKGTLELTEFRTLGPAESIFVTPSGSVLDSGVTFQGGSFSVIPEPSPSWLLGIGLVAGAGYCFRRTASEGESGPFSVSNSLKSGGDTA